MYNKYNKIAFKKVESFLNLDLNTTTFGLFDRYYWSWKKKDFADATLQYAYVLMYKNNNFEKEYLDSMFKSSLKNLMLKNGSVNQSYPNENHPKTFLDIVPVFKYLLKDNIDEELIKMYKDCLLFSLEKEEEYGTIINHVAHDMYQYLLSYDLLNDQIYYEKALSNLENIIKMTSSEGWHQEYSNADAGYQTRALKYITKSIEFFTNNDKQRCIDLAKISASFLDKVILPDGTIYSVFGSRNTSLIYPSGIEYMAFHYPNEFSDLCYRVRKSVVDELSILPLQLEFDNFIRLFDDFLEAQVWYDQNINIPVPQKKETEFDLEEYGLKKIVKEDYSIFIHYKYGGAIVIYKKNKLFYKNGGILVKNDKTWYGSKNILNPSSMKYKDNEYTIKTEIYKSIHQEVTPVKLVVLRLLNLTVLKYGFIADIFRKVIVRLMISGKKESNNNIVMRQIKVLNDKISIIDRFDFNFKPEKIYRTSYLNLFHMASSRYKHPVDEKLNYSEEIKEDNEINILLKEHIGL